MKFIDEHIQEVYDIVIKKDQEKILNRIGKLLKREGLKEINYSQNKVEFLRTSNAMNPFRGYGRISISLKPVKDGTLVNCQIIPYDGYFGYMIISGAFIMLLWTMAGILISGKHIQLILIAGWLMAILGTAVYCLVNKLMLRSFFKYFIRKISK